MKRKNIIPYIAIALLVLLTTNACLKKELSDYDPHKIEEIQLDAGLEDRYLLKVGEVLSISPDLAKEGLNPNDYTFKWYYYPSKANSEEVRVAAGSTPDLLLESTMATGDYYLVLEAENNSTKVKYFKKMSLVVRRPTSEGWLLLTYKNNKTNLSIVTPEYIVVKDFLVPTSQYPMSEKPVELICMNDWDATVQPIAIRTEEPQIYFLDHNTFEVKSTANDAFVSGTTTQFDFFAADMWYQMYYLKDTEGNLYVTSRGSGEDDNFPSGFSDAMLGNYIASPVLIPTESSYPVQVVIYDIQGKRFLYQPSFESILSPFQAKDPTSPFDLSNFTDRIVYSGLGAGVKSYIVGADNQNKYSLYELIMDGGAKPSALDAYPASFKQPITVPGHAEPRLFALSGKLPMLYFIAGNNLYLYKMNEQFCELVYSFPSDETVVSLKMLRQPITSTLPAADNRLAIAANDSEGGIFYTFDLLPTGLIKGNNYATRIDGFDPIVDIVYKESK